MPSILKKLWRNRWVLRSLPSSIYLNFHYLPFRQAVKLPILTYKPKLDSCKGTVTIEGPIRFGMIKLGAYTVSIYPNNGIMFSNRGKIIFNGETRIGNDSAISVNETGTLTFGEHFSATCGFRVACYNSISFDRRVLVGWNCMFSDTDFHLLKNISGHKRGIGYGPISIGHDCWIANGCKIYKNVTIPHSCVVGADTALVRAVDLKPYSLICNDTPVKVKVEGVWHDLDDNIIVYK